MTLKDTVASCYGLTYFFYKKPSSGPSSKSFLSFGPNFSSKSFLTVSKLIEMNCSENDKKPSVGYSIADGCEKSHGISHTGARNRMEMLEN